jgi:hypothetical protein
VEKVLIVLINALFKKKILLEKNKNYSKLVILYQLSVINFCVKNFKKILIYLSNRKGFIFLAFSLIL